MKSIFYIGAALMVGAGIYGFVDYRKTNETKEFRSLYEEKEIRGTNPHSTVETERKPVLIQDEPVKMASSATVFAAKPKEETKPIAKAGTQKQRMKKSRKLNYKLFSRAALEKFEPPTVNEFEVKEVEIIAEKETEKKEQ